MTFLLHQLLSESAGRQPDAVAVRSKDGAVSYGELEAKSNQFAHALIERGVHRGDRVALYTQKSIDSLVAIFGILKAGAAYVPVELKTPVSRLADVIEQCSIRHVVTHADALERLDAESFSPPVEHVLSFGAPAGGLPGAEVAAVDAALDGSSSTPPVVPSSDQDLAYVLFTSGSTGRPKGVMLSHLNALTFVNWAQAEFGVDASDRLSSHAPLTFDLSIFDIFAAIKGGASISLVPDRLSMFPTRLADFIRNEEITVWYSVPSVLTLLVTHGGLADRLFPRLRLVLFAGEVFPTKHLRELMRLLPHPRYFNLYGPTETNVCTFYEVVEPPEDDRPIPIGKSCANMEAIAIDEHGDPVTRPGQEGMLYVRSSAVMQGYYGRPRETRAAFHPNPFAEGRDEQLYRTGDVVTVDEHGDYIYVGRLDHMVKTRGYRVELGEIETVLYSHPSVREAVAFAVPDDLLGNRLHAAVVVDHPTDVDGDKLRAHCARVLPRYMIPELITFRERLPRTATDKVDRSLLADETTAALMGGTKS
jgi:amino acid adenylation domain-containing protein